MSYRAILLQSPFWAQKPSVNHHLLSAHERIMTSQVRSKTRVRKLYNHVMTQIKSRLLQEKVCRRVDQAGSALYDVQIGADVTVFDALLIMDASGLSIVPSTTNPDCFYLIVYKRFFFGIDEKYLPYMDEKEENMVVPDRVGNMVFKTLAKILTHLALQNTTRLSQQGSVVTLNMLEGGQPLYCVNFIPCFEETETWLTDAKRQFISKPLRHRRHLAKSELIWRQCFSQEEAVFFETLHRVGESDCRKALLRLCYAIRASHRTLRHFSTYHFKSIIYTQSQTHSAAVYWHMRELPARLLDVFRNLETCCVSGQMPHPVLGSDVNLLDHVSTEVMRQAVMSLRRLRTCKLSFEEAVRAAGDISTRTSQLHRSLSADAGFYNFSRDVTSFGKSHDQDTCAECKRAELEENQSSCIVQ